MRDNYQVFLSTLFLTPPHPLASEPIFPSSSKTVETPKDRCRVVSRGGYWTHTPVSNLGYQTPGTIVFQKYINNVTDYTELFCIFTDSGYFYYYLVSRSTIIWNYIDLFIILTVVFVHERLESLLWKITLYEIQQIRKKITSAVPILFLVFLLGYSFFKLYVKPK